MLYLCAVTNSTELSYLSLTFAVKYWVDTMSFLYVVETFISKFDCLGMRHDCQALEAVPRELGRDFHKGRLSH